MKAVVKTEKGEGFLCYQEAPEPDPGPGQVKVEVKACGICGTDLHIQDDEFPYYPPVVLGHEFSGIVAGVGEGVSEIRLGQRVVSEVMYDLCGTCRFCRTGLYNLCPNRRGLGWSADGAFAEFTIVEADMVHSLPEELSFDEGALGEPLAVAVCAVSELTKVAAGDVVLVTGPGPIGILVAQVARAEGGYVTIVGTADDAERLSLARALDFNTVQDEDAPAIEEMLARLGSNQHADIVFECAGANQAASIGLQIVRRGGKYTQVGLFGQQVQLDVDIITYKELRVQGIFSSNWRGWARGLRLAANKQVDLSALISHRLPLADWGEGFRLAREKGGLKVLLVP